MNDTTTFIIATLPEDKRHDLQERSGIKEDSGIDREEADKQALLELQKKWIMEK